MRFIHKVRLMTTAAVLFGSIFLAATSALAVTILTPTEGRMVRDQVPIIIPRYTLPANVATSGFLTIKIDGRFLAAVDAAIPPVEGKSPLNPNIVYMWDTKRAINDPTIPASQRNYRDGKHTILVEAFTTGASATSKDQVVESATVNVTLRNQVQRPNPAPPLNLKYHYTVGVESKYKVSAKCDILDATGYSLTGGLSPVTGEYSVIQAIEDKESSRAALLRYKVDPYSAYTQVFGDVSMLGQITRFYSVYKIIDIFGNVVDPNVMSGALRAEITDCLLTLPGHSVQVGDKWPVNMHLKLEGLSDYGKFKGMGELERLEWEGGYECAKIVSQMTGSIAFNFLSLGRMDLRAVNTAYFAYKPGKLIKDVTVIEFDTSMPNEMLASLQQQMPSAGSFQQSKREGLGGTPAPVYRSVPKSRAASNSVEGAPAGSGQTAVSVRLVITKELVGK